MDQRRVLSIQSHVVSGYVGNKSATFPLQLLGFEVEAINSVQFSNHTGYKKNNFPSFKGQVLNESELTELIDGLRTNELLNYSHMLTGYVGSASFLRKVAEVIKEVKSINPALIYVCDPVLGDNGKMYVPPELLPIYQNQIIIHADVLTPNQFETELLTSIAIKTDEDAVNAMNQLHNQGIPTVVITSTNLGSKDKLVAFASTVKGEKVQLKLEMPRFSPTFTGTGDLFTALLLAWLSNTNHNLKESCEKVINTMQMVLNLTCTRAESLSGKMEDLTVQRVELRLIQSRDFILNPKNNLKAISL